MKKILVIRFSALGDVAISVSVIKNFLAQYPDKEIIFLTRKSFVPLFRDIKRIEFITPDLKNYKGFIGLFRLFGEINSKFDFSEVIDIHNVLRTKVLRFFFFFTFAKCFKIGKGRSEKRKAVRFKNKILKKLPHSSERYANVFEKAGYKINLTTRKLNKKSIADTEITEKLNLKSKNIGIAPFAFHKQKQYPIEKMRQVIEILDKEDISIFIFGGGQSELEIAENLESHFENVTSLVGKYNLEKELDIISNLNLMLTMDSGNMHIANLAGAKTLSVWGATHPYLGFYSTGNYNEDLFIQIPEKDLPCRPCSVFGKKKCFRNDIACLNNIAPETIAEKVLKNC